MKLSGEGILISALIHTQDVGAAAGYGVTPTHFKGYADEYNWLLNYLETYSTSPSWEIFSAAFPNFPKGAHEDVRSACDLVFKQYGKQQLQEAMQEALDLLKMGDVAAADGVLKDVHIRRTAPKPKRLLTDLDFLDNWDQVNPSIDVPYSTLQRHTGGIRPGNVWYFAARPGQGKSAHLVNFCVRAVLDGARVKFYSLEMNENEVRFRFHAALATHFGYKGITLNDMRDRRLDAHTYKQFVTELADRLAGTGGHLDIHTPREGLVSPSVLAASASEYHLNVVDYIGLMRADSGSRSVDDWRVAASISNDIKTIAASSATGMLVASQINREGDHGDKPPKLRNLAQSDALGQDGDVVVTLRAMPHNVASYLSLEKNRHGQDNVRFHTTFDPNRGIFKEIDAAEAEGLALAAEESIY